MIFVNTARRERKSLESFPDLLEWGHNQEVLVAAEAQRLALAAGKRPADAEAAVNKALEMRACLERIFVKLANRQTASATDLTATWE